MLLDDRVLRGFQNAVETAEHGERQDDPAIFRLPVIAAKKIRDRPDERGKLRLRHGRQSLRNEI
jgi:hypothetical protein